MNDRYLWRGKRINNGKWFIGLLCKHTDNFVYMCDRYRIEYCDIIPETIGQCTGEKMQKPPYKTYFYEVDIVRAYWYDDKGELITDIMVICWHNGAFVGLSATYQKPRPILDIAERGGEIIGNICDNADLLAVKK